MMRLLVMGFLFVALFAATARAQDIALTKEEAASFGAQVAQCWNVAASKTAVTIAFDLGRNGKPEGQSLRLVGADASAAEVDAFANAGRAILRCGGRGYKLPLAKYDQW